MNLLCNVVTKRDKMEFTDPEAICAAMGATIKAVEMLKTKFFSFRVICENKDVVFAFADSEIGREWCTEVARNACACNKYSIDLTDLAACDYAEFDAIYQAATKTESIYAERQLEYLKSFNDTKYSDDLVLYTEEVANIGS